MCTLTLPDRTIPLQNVATKTQQKKRQGQLKTWLKEEKELSLFLIYTVQGG